MTRILVVDDEPALRDTVSYALRQEGFQLPSIADVNSYPGHGSARGNHLLTPDLRRDAHERIRSCTIAGSR